MELAESKLGQTTILEASGRLDQKAAPTLELALSDLVARGETHILLDLADLESLGGAGMRVLLGFSRRLETSGGQLVLCSLRPEVREVFDVAGFSFSLEPDRKSALRRLPTATRPARISALARKLLGVGARTPKRPAPTELSADDEARIRRLSQRVRNLMNDPHGEVRSAPEPELPPAPAPSPTRPLGRAREALAALVSRFRSE